MQRSVTPLAALLSALLLCALTILPTASAQEDATFTEGELAQMLAPIALYPDSLLSQILMAATYPLEVVEAARWSRDNPDLEGSAAVDAVEDQDWDPSVKALVAFPRVLAHLNEDLNWTRNLGDAFLLQEEDVAAVIQDLRRRADEAGHLEEQEHVRVVREREVIYIEPANPRVVYVPYYRPSVVYGGWWWPAYAPVYWYPPRGYTLSFGITWISGIPVSHGFFFSSFDWHHRHVIIVRNYDRHRHLGTARPHTHRWRHDPWHRRGVAYKHRSVKERFTGHVGSGTRSGVRPGTGSGFRTDAVPARRTVERHAGRDERNRRYNAPPTRAETRDGRYDSRRGSTWSGRDRGTAGRNVTRRSASPGAGFRDSPGPARHTETVRRDLERRRAQMEQRRGTIGQGRSIRPGNEQAQRPDRAPRRVEPRRSERSGAGSRPAPRTGKAPTRRAEGGSRAGGRDARAGRPSARGSSGPGPRTQRGEGRRSFAR